MIAMPENTSPSQGTALDINLSSQSDRRLDVDAKHQLIANVLKEVGCDALLVLAPENFAWLTAGGAARGILDTEALPALYYNSEGRWLISSNADTQRLFDEEIDSMGFQVKEWNWHQGRASLLEDLCQGRKVACDVPFSSCSVIGVKLQSLRLSLSEYERACYRALGQIVAHALEATGRTIRQGETEREVAGQLSHRLIHRGAIPLSITVAADGRSRLYRQGSFTAATIRSYCVLTVTARKYGLCARASRSVCFDQPDPLFRKEHDAACKVSATYVASSWPDAVPRQILASGQRIYQITGAEYEWYLCPQGQVTGRLPVEIELTPRHEDVLQSNWAVSWHASVGAAVSCDTFLISEDGPTAVTAPENWPLKRIRIQGAEFVRPDLLLR
ncbi:MAG: M24 family metallopeptidase [Gemmataceae bacterium]|nr:M24 family metallopeptidase [Gemmataceae bacterium]